LLFRDIKLAEFSAINLLGSTCFSVVCHRPWVQ